MNENPEIIRNKATGDSIEFIQTDEGTKGRVSEFIMTLSPNSSWAKSPKHFHPFQTETFKVISGELNLNVGKEHLILTPNHNKIIVDKFVLHSFWNDTNKEVKFIAEIYPPRDIEKGIRKTYELADKGKINKRNIPYNPFYSLILMKQFDSYFHYIPWKFQRLVFNFGARIALMFGYK
ncbi:Cupin 2, conserved barrel [Flavobacteriales bacterium ALC-1]|nr:Cupin 2, conserved barrel [Flavobacteriales bacterium ALC-1]